MTASRSPIRVCLVMRHFFPALAGDSERFRRYAPELRRRGVELEVVTSRHEASLKCHEVIADEITVHRVECVDEKGVFDDRKLFRHFTYLLDANKVHANVVQTTLASTPILMDLWRLRMRGLRLVHVSTMVGVGSSSIRQKVRHAVCLSAFHQLIVSSREMSRWSASMWAGLSRQEIIPNGVDTKRFRPARNQSEKLAIRRDLGLPEHAPIVLFVGNILPRKGLHLLLEAWHEITRRFTDGCLVVVGPTSRPTVIHKQEKDAMIAYQESILRAASTFSGNSVRFVGQRGDVELFYRCSDVFVLPSEQEGMGNVVLEAYASRLPCVLTNFVGLPKEEFGYDDRTFILVRQDSNEIASAVCSLLESSNLRLQMGAEALIKASTELSLTSTLDQYVNMYQRLAYGD